MHAAPCSTLSTKWHVPSISSDFRISIASFVDSEEDCNCDYYAVDSCHARLFRRKATSEIRHEGSSANVSFGEYEDAGEYPRRLGAFLVAKRKLHYCSKMRMQNQSVLVIGFACAVASKCYFTLLGVVGFCRRRKMRATISRIAIESTPTEALPVSDVVVATRKVPIIEAVLPKIS